MVWHLNVNNGPFPQHLFWLVFVGKSQTFQITVIGRSGFVQMWQWASMNNSRTMKPTQLSGFQPSLIWSFSPALFVLWQKCLLWEKKSPSVGKKQRLSSKRNGEQTRLWWKGCGLVVCIKKYYCAAANIRVSDVVSSLKVAKSPVSLSGVSELFWKMEDVLCLKAVSSVRRTVRLANDNLLASTYHCDVNADCCGKMAPSMYVLLLLWYSICHQAGFFSCQIEVWTVTQGNTSAVAQPKQEETLFSRVTIPQVAVERLEQLWELYTAKKKTHWWREKRRRRGRGIETDQT